MKTTIMESNQTVTVWKSDFKDFPFLYEATLWVIGRTVQKAKNFIVIAGYNPYELRNEQRFQDSEITYSSCIELAKEYGYESQVTELLHNFSMSPMMVFQKICDKLNYPEHHIRRQW